MTLYIGVDFHPHQQTVAWCDTQTGETSTCTLQHNLSEVLKFYQSVSPSVVGIEASSRAVWFEQLLSETNHQLLVGNPTLIRARARSRHKSDARDAQLILDLLVKDEFPAIWRRSAASSQIIDVETRMYISNKATLLLLLGILALHVATAQAAPTISVNANPVRVPSGENVGNTVITWDAENNRDAEVWRQIDGGDETQFSGDSKGVELVAIRVGRKYTFMLYSEKPYFGTSKNPRAKVLASVEVSAVNSGSGSGSRPSDRTPLGTPVPADWPGGVKQAPSVFSGD